jgi:putative nucleotidyltransferase with HDIG domain
MCTHAEGLRLLTREAALDLVNGNLTKKNLVKHVLAVESIMKALASRFGEDEDLWAIAGLLHDLDYERTAETPEKHGFETLEILESADVPDEVKHAILAHTGHVERTSMMDKAIYCTDPVTGLIVASALMHPTRSLAGMDAAFVGNRFKEKRFAAGANREAIASCSELGLKLHEFLEVALDAMRGISRELGL